MRVNAASDRSKAQQASHAIVWLSRTELSWPNMVRRRGARERAPKSAGEIRTFERRPVGPGPGDACESEREAGSRAC